MMDYIRREKQSSHIWLSVMVGSAAWLAVGQIALAVLCMGGGIYLARAATKKSLSEEKA